MTALAEDLPSAAPGPERLFEIKLRRRRLRRLFASLTQPQHRVVWLRVVHQLSYPEIAAQLGMSLAAVKSLAHRSTLGVEQAGGMAAF